MDKKNVIILNNESFDKVIAEGVTLVDFWAAWCAPCLMQTPILEKVLEKVGNGVKIGKLDVDENREIAMKFNISSIPTLIIFKDGVVKDQMLGVQDENTLLKKLND
jgi:thioredoxin 1